MLEFLRWISAAGHRVWEHLEAAVLGWRFPEARRRCTRRSRRTSAGRSCSARRSGVEQDGAA